MKVAFGTDFTQDQHIQSISGGDDLLYLISHSFEGVMKVLMNPLSKVSVMHLMKAQLICY